MMIRRRRRKRRKGVALLKRMRAVVEGDCEERPSSEKILRFPGRDDKWKKCRVIINRLPFYLDNGRPRVGEF